MKQGLYIAMFCCFFLADVPFCEAVLGFGGNNPKTQIRVSVIYNDGEPVEDRNVEVTLQFARINKAVPAIRKHKNRGPFLAEFKGYEGKVIVMAKSGVDGLKPPIVERELNVDKGGEYDVTVELEKPTVRIEVHDQWDGLIADQWLTISANPSIPGYERMRTRSGTFQIATLHKGTLLLSVEAENPRLSKGQAKLYLNGQDESVKITVQRPERYAYVFVHFLDSSANDALMAQREIIVSFLHPVPGFEKPISTTSGSLEFKVGPIQGQDDTLKAELVVTLRTPHNGDLPLRPQPVLLHTGKNNWGIRVNEEALSFEFEPESEER